MQDLCFFDLDTGLKNFRSFTRRPSYQYGAVVYCLSEDKFYKANDQLWPPLQPLSALITLGLLTGISKLLYGRLSNSIVTYCLLHFIGLFFTIFYTLITTPLFQKMWKKKLEKAGETSRNLVLTPNLLQQEESKAVASESPILLLAILALCVGVSGGIGLFLEQNTRPIFGNMFPLIFWGMVNLFTSSFTALGVMQRRRLLKQWLQESDKRSPSSIYTQ